MSAGSRASATISHMFMSPRLPERHALWGAQLGDIFYGNQKFSWTAALLMEIIPPYHPGFVDLSMSPRQRMRHQITECPCHHFLCLPLLVRPRVLRPRTLGKHGATVISCWP